MPAASQDGASTAQDGAAAIPTADAERGIAGAWDIFRSPFARSTRVTLARPWSRTVTLLDRAMAPFWNLVPLYAVLVLSAVAASIWGFVSFYGSQYARVPAYTWPFIPDSPLSTSAWIVASLLIKLGLDKRRDATGKTSAFFVNWAAMMNAKVGVWTAFVLLFFYDHFFTPGREWFQWMLVASHLGMVVFAVLLFRKAPPLGVGGYLGVLALGLLWDFMDYLFVPLFLPGSGITVFPNGVPTDPGPIRTVAIVTMGMTVVATLLLPLGMRLRGPPVER